MALLAVPVLFIELWTVVTWLMDGPYQITEYRRGRTRDWYGARILDGITILLSIIVLRIVVRDCRKQRRVFTFDVMFLICGVSTFWLTSAVNFFVPMFSYSSNFVNLNDPCGHIPFVVNPDCGRVPNPIISMTGLESTVVLGAAMVIQSIVRRIQGRWPHLSRPQLVGVMTVIGCTMALVEPLAIIPLHIWTWAGSPVSIEIGGDGYTYPIIPEILAFGGFLSLATALRMFRDDRGRTVVERGLDHYSPRVRRLVTWLALYFAMQFLVGVVASSILWPLGFHQNQWGTMEPSLNNGLCDQPGIVENTRYGPCPGSPGFRMPISGSLPGDGP